MMSARLYCCSWFIIPARHCDHIPVLSVDWLESLLSFYVSVSAPPSLLVMTPHCFQFDHINTTTSPSRQLNKLLIQIARDTRVVILNIWNMITLTVSVKYFWSIWWNYWALWLWIIFAITIYDIVTFLHTEYDSEITLHTNHCRRILHKRLEILLHKVLSVELRHQVRKYKY